MESYGVIKFLVTFIVVEHMFRDHPKMSMFSHVFKTYTFSYPVLKCVYINILSMPKIAMKMIKN